MKRQKHNTVKHGSEGRWELQGGTAENPYTEGPAYIQVVRNIGTETWKKSKSLTLAHIEAGNWFFGRYSLGRGSMGIVGDFEREPVDTSISPSDLSDATVQAAKDLIHVETLLGKKPFRLLELVIGQGHTIQTAAHMYEGTPTRTTFEHVGFVFRDALEELAIYCGYASRNERRVG